MKQVGELRYLTKSHFKVAYECPAKLFYHGRPETYGNRNRNDDFLKALAQGGFQVGALAKFYYPDGTDLEGLNTDEAIKRTEELLNHEKVTIFDAAIQTGFFLVKVDVLKKDGNNVSLIEVKSSSFDSSSHEGFFKKRGSGLDSSWEPYLVDVSFQTWVANQAYPEWNISSHLMLADRSVKATVDGLHQHFKLAPSDQHGSHVTVDGGLSEEELGEPILTAVQVDEEVRYIISKKLFPLGLRLPEFAHYLAKNLRGNDKGLARTSSLCKRCEFRVSSDITDSGLKSGFDECWENAKKITAKDKGRGLIFDIWNLRKIDELLFEDKLFLDQITVNDLRPDGEPKIPRSFKPYMRQRIQVDKYVLKDSEPFVDYFSLDQLFKKMFYPIHCIDFETSMAAIPFHAGRRPYEQIAFQFSHHVLHEDGRVAHVDQYLNSEPGKFPNFDFVRSLKKSLSGDDGTIFRYATHENSVLRQIRSQLVDTPQSDQEELISFIDSITQPRKDERGRTGARNMVDLRALVLKNYYHPLMGGSNSIKKVIPAILEDSAFLRGKYSQPVYGERKLIPSLNFKEKAWIEIGEDGRVKDPYKQLSPIFSDIHQKFFDEESPLFSDDSIKDGGAAMTAWSRMQFTEMKDVEREAIYSALLKYCELDTLSMIWLLEYWRDLTKEFREKLSTEYFLQKGKYKKSKSSRVA